MRKSIEKIVMSIAGIAGIISLVFLCFDIRWNRFWEKIGELSTQIGKSNVILKALTDYSNVFVASVIAIIVALLSITITMYVFLKSALDRAIDENQYISAVTNIYQNQTSRKLLFVSVLNFAVMLLAIGWHFFLTFQNVHIFRNVEAGMISFAVLFGLDLILTGWFWSRCIGVRGELRKIIQTECDKCITQMKEMLKYGNSEAERSVFYKNICLLIGYWSIWETAELDQNVVDHQGKLEYEETNEAMKQLIAMTEGQLCHMTSDQYINLFSRTEVLLLSGGHHGSEREADEGDIITVIQERSDILRPTIDPPKDTKEKNVEEKDFAHRKYRRDDVLQSEVSVLTYIKEFRHKVGYRDGNEGQKAEFFSGTENLYQILKSYRNLKISERLTPAEKTKENTEEVDQIMVIGIYYFLLRVLALFVSAVQLSDFTFNGGTLNFANFYSSTLERVSFYSNQFYHTIFARTKVMRSVMDLSLFDNIDFFHTAFEDTSLNNSIFTDVLFESAQIRHSSLSICEFRRCLFKRSALIDTELNGSIFDECQLESVDFSGSRIFGISLHKTFFTACGFRGAEIQGWEWKDCQADKFLKSCDFSDSTWEDMELMKADLTNTAFSNAVMIGTKIENSILKGTLFKGSKLIDVQFIHCIQFEQTSFESANLFGAVFEYCNMELSNLYQVDAGNTTIKYCNMNNCDCAEANFRWGDFNSVSFQWSRLYDATLSGAKINDCHCEYALADHMEFTYAFCEKDYFSCSSMMESNFSGTIFKYCDFNGSNLSGSIATKTTFSNCILSQADFSNIRFLNAVFQEEEIESCDFSKCKFEKTIFQKIVFSRCIFNHTFFSNCTFENVEFKNCRILWKEQERVLKKPYFRHFGDACSVNNVRFTVSA